METMFSKYIRPEDAAKQLKVTPNTLRIWGDNGKITFIRTNGGHRRYDINSIMDFKNNISVDNKDKDYFCYCRVSTHQQKDNLDKQIKCLTNKYPHYKLIVDISTGLTFKRDGLQTILDSANKGNLREVIVTHKDRLCRFGYELFEKIVLNSGGKIISLNKENTVSEKELIDDIVSIVNVFSTKLTGLKSSIIKKQINEGKENINTSINKNIDGIDICV